MSAQPNTMTYNGYSARIEYDDDNAIFFGRIAGIRAIITFDSDNATGLKAAFIEAVDDYLAFCKQRGETPQKPYSGKITLRVDPGVHAAVATASHLKHQSINQWAANALEVAAQQQ